PGGRGPRRTLRTRLLLPISEHHGEVQHIGGDTRLRLLPRGWPLRPRVAVPSLHAKGGNRWPCIETAHRATTVLQKNEEGTRSAPRRVHRPRRRLRPPWHRAQGTRHLRGEQDLSGGDARPAQPRVDRGGLPPAHPEGGRHPPLDREVRPRPRAPGPPVHPHEGRVPRPPE